MGYVYISKIYFDFLKRIIPHTSSVFMYSCFLTLYYVYKLRTLQPSLPMNKQWQHTYRIPSSRPVI